jgi:predicted Zn finger-like uncharacterized protein
MIITCPACSAKYNVAETAIPEQGRTVKCAACAHQWVQFQDGATRPSALARTAGATPKPSASATPNDATAKVSAKKSKAASKFAFPALSLPFLMRKAGGPKKPVAAFEAQRQKTHGKIKGTLRLAAGASWALVIAIAVGGIAYAVSHRTDIVRAWPKSASAFSLIGFPANLYGIDITGVQVASGVDQTGPRIIVAGVLQSVSRTTEPVAWLRVALVDTEGKEVGNWMVDPGVTELAPGTSHQFRTIKRNPPRGELKAVVTFGEPPRLAPRPPPEPLLGEDGLMGAQAKGDDALKAKVEGGHATPVVGGR